MPLNPELVERKITLILGDLDSIRQLSRMTIEEYLADPRNEALAEKYLERVMGRAIDINYHIVSEVLLVSPKDYADSFTSLEKVGVLEPTAARSFARLSGLRNRITHEYNGLDEKLVHASLGKVAEELPGYLSAVRAYMRQRQGSPQGG